MSSTEHTTVYVGAAINSGASLPTLIEMDTAYREYRRIRSLDAQALKDIGIEADARPGFRQVLSAIIDRRK